MKNILHILLLLGIFSLSHGEDLLGKYKKKMDTTSVHANDEVSKSEDVFKVSKTKSIYREIKTITSMKKNTFESTNDFIRRRDKAIKKIDDKMSFYFKNGSREYSAGTVQMKRYNPDTQIMVLTLFWNEKLVSLFANTNLVKTTSISMKREEAKKLFGKNEKHFFHIKFMYLHNNITISEILLYNKYILYKNINKIVSNSTVLETQKKSTQVMGKSAKPILPKCKSYEVQASKLNIRNEPSKRSKILGTVVKGEKVCVYEFYNGWAKTDYGWISKSYVKPKQVKPTQTTKKNTATSHASASSSDKSSSSDSSYGWWIILLILFILFKK